MGREEKNGAGFLKGNGGYQTKGKKKKKKKKNGERQPVKPVGQSSGGAHPHVMSLVRPCDCPFRFGFQPV